MDVNDFLIINRNQFFENITKEQLKHTVGKKVPQSESMQLSKSQITDREIDRRKRLRMRIMDSTILNNRITHDDVLKYYSNYD